MASIFIGYVQDLFCALWDVMLKECEVPVMMLPPPALCDSLEKPEKQKAIAEHHIRFSKIIVCVCV